MVSKTHRRDVVLGDFEKRGHEHHVRLYADKNADDETHWVDFKIYEVIGYDSETKQRHFHRDGSNNGADGTTSYDEADTAAEGFVKWDGCTQFGMIPIHADDKYDLIALFAAVLKARELAAEEMPGKEIQQEYVRPVTNRVRGQRF